MLKLRITKKKVVKNLETGYYDIAGYYLTNGKVEDFVALDDIKQCILEKRLQVYNFKEIYNNDLKELEKLERQDKIKAAPEFIKKVNNELLIRALASDNRSISEIVNAKLNAQVLYIDTDGYVKYTNYKECLNHPEVSSLVTSTSELFRNYPRVSLDLSDYDFSNVIDMGAMFYHCVNLRNLNLGNFDTRKVKDFSFLFHTCRSLKDLDISVIDTSNAETMEAMFYETAFENLDLRSFNTSKVRDFSYMFFNSSNLKNIDLSNFDTSSAKNFQSMFGKCSSLTSLDLGSFDTSKVSNMKNMFFRCSNLRYLDLSNFSVKHARAYTRMFEGCRSLDASNICFGNKDKKNTDKFFNDMLPTLWES